MDGSTCGQCRHWRASKDQMTIGERAGECWASPPAVIAMQRGSQLQLIGVRPPVSDKTAACGEMELGLEGIVGG